MLFVGLIDRVYMEPCSADIMSRLVVQISVCLHFSVLKNKINQPFVQKFGGLFINIDKLVNKNIFDLGKLQRAHQT